MLIKGREVEGLDLGARAPEGPSTDIAAQAGSLSICGRIGLQKASPDREEEYDDDEWDTDPENARNWCRTKKWVNVFIVSFYCFITPLSSSMMAPGLLQIGEKYGVTSPTVIGLSLSIFLISFGVGPLFLSPMSEMYGRRWILHISNLITIGFNLGCAFAPDIGTLLVLRFIAGFSASGPISVGGGTIKDLFEPNDRASAMSLFTVGPLFGPAIGPAISGFVVQTVGVKYVFVVIAATSGLAALIGIPLFREPYAPVLRMAKAKRSHNPELAVAKVVKNLGDPTGSKVHVIWTSLTRPLALLFGNLVCFMLSSFMAFNYGIYYLMFATFARLFHDTYGFKPGVGGLTYLGLGFGFFTASLVCAKFSDRLYRELSKRNHGQGTPEMRMPLLFIASVLVPIGLLWYGWSAHFRIHWIMPIIGTAIFGFGLMAAHLGIQLYLVDAFKYAASAIGAANLFRSIFGFAFPLFGQQMSDRLGLGGANSLLAGLALLLGAPFPIWIFYRGAAIRERGNVNR